MRARLTVVDCVNPVAESRCAWRDIATRGRTRLVEFEIIYSDPIEHRSRVERQIYDIPGMVAPTWQEVLEHSYEARTEPYVVIDTGRHTADRAAAAVLRHIDALL